jgi:hypothetical protein
MAGSDSSASDTGATFFGAVFVGAMAYVLHTCGQLPPVVATHFSRAGDAIGFVSQPVYRAATMILLVLPALLLVVLPRVRLRRPEARINVPNRDYWLAPERRQETVEVIVQRCTLVASLLIVFICYAHWLVVHANREQPPTLSSGWLLGGLVVFMGLTARCAGGLIGYFRADPSGE